MLNENVRHIIEQELHEDEELLWAEKPRWSQNILDTIFHSFSSLWGKLSIISVIIASIVFCVSMLGNYLEHWAIQYFIFLLMIPILVACGDGIRITLILTPLAYAVTDMRALVIRGPLRKRTQHIKLSNLEDLCLHNWYGRDILVFEMQPHHEANFSYFHLNEAGNTLPLLKKIINESQSHE